MYLAPTIAAHHSVDRVSVVTKKTETSRRGILANKNRPRFRLPTEFWSAHHHHHVPAEPTRNEIL